MRRVDLSGIDFIDPDIIQAIPPDVVFKFKVIPFASNDNYLSVACSNPFDIFAQEAIKSYSNIDAEFCYTPKAQVDEFIRKIYPDEGADFEDYDDNSPDDEMAELADIDDLKNEGEDAPAIRHVNTIFLNAIQERASDIHIEPQGKSLMILYRIDGVLRKAGTFAMKLHAGIVSRIKILSSLDISERRLPQDGRSKIKIFGRDIDVRVSTLPTINGEKVVLRILDKDLHSLNITELGLEKGLQEKFKQSLSEPYGMILVTGPTGSGKTTTLYSALNYVNGHEKNIITVEDPVEYQIRGINQVHARPDIGLTFSAGLRSMLRQDPDIIMVGEIRDLETAEIAMRASLTGHLVFSTLHTNDSISSIMRLIDMGIDPYLICSSVHLVIAQRLVRHICLHCSEEYELSQEVIDRLGESADFFKGTVLRRGRGCYQCADTGYWGRVAVFEFFHLDNAMRSLILSGKNLGEIQQIAKEQGMETLKKNSMRKVKQGLTTIDEVFRVTSNSF